MHTCQSARVALYEIAAPGSSRQGECAKAVVYMPSLSMVKLLLLAFDIGRDEAPDMAPSVILFIRLEDLSVT